MKIIFAEPLGVGEDLLKETRSHFESKGHEFTYYLTRPQDAVELRRRSREAEILTLSNIPVGAETIDACRNLKLLNVAFTGVDHVDLEACRKRNLSVCNASGYSTVGVSELAVAMTLALLRDIPRMDSRTRNLCDRNNFSGSELHGKTVGIVGTGAIGLATAALFHAFGCKIVAYSRTTKDIDYIEYMPLESLLSRSDVITLHVPANTSTYHLISRELLACMKPSAVIINTARGPVVDTDALAQALNEDKIAGAAIDVYDSEPPLATNHPLLTAKNTILLPHIAYATKEAMIKRIKIVVDNIDSFLAGDLQNKIM